MDTDRLGQGSRRLTRRVQGLTTGHWVIVGGLAGLAVVSGWVCTSLPAEDSDPWVTLSVSRTADGDGSPVNFAPWDRCRAANAPWRWFSC